MSLRGVALRQGELDSKALCLPLPFRRQMGGVAYLEHQYVVDEHLLAELAVLLL